MEVEGNVRFRVYDGPFGPNVEITGYGDHPFFAMFEEQEWEMLAWLIGAACARARGY